jgi:hypothetical protein
VEHHLRHLQRRLGDLDHSASQLLTEIVVEVTEGGRNDSSFTGLPWVRVGLRFGRERILHLVARV